MIIIGIDPGFGGALALVSDGRLTSFSDMPTRAVTYKNKSRQEIDTNLVMAKLEMWRDLYGAEHITIEKVGTMPKQGITGAFRFGEGYGMIRAAATLTNLGIDYVTPAVWKRHFHLSGSKGVARTLAQDKWPKYTGSFDRVKDDGRAEAALIALWREHNESIK